MLIHEAALRGAGATLPAITKVLRILKHTEDATAEPATQNCHLLCDVGTAIARAIVEQHCPWAAGSSGQFPGHVLLPRYLFRQLDSRMLSRGACAWPPSCSSCMQALPKPEGDGA